MNHCYLATQMIQTLIERNHDNSYIRDWERGLDNLSTDKVLVKLRGFDHYNRRHLARKLGVNVMELIAVTDFIVERT
ncbi:MAG: hypothetical protein RPR97_13615 [Colwellia sp.]